MMAALAKDDDIVVYCSDVNCHASVAVYQFLLEHGYRRVRRYSGGLFDWESAGQPLEGEWIREGKDHG
jgi:rhodanese-related sulfurtransferase